MISFSFGAVELLALCLPPFLLLMQETASLIRERVNSILVPSFRLGYLLFALFCGRHALRMFTPIIILSCLTTTPEFH
tara:strand:- start:12731 stop:12964 length:234 start_codon:yes stop_codon:yes gene_type:complete